jgi:hypothetical protein
VEIYARPPASTLQNACRAGRKPLGSSLQNLIGKSKMTVSNSRFNKLKVEFFLFQGKLSVLRRINKLLDLARKQIPKAYTINGERKGKSEEILYRSIIYTLFYANFLSASLIIGQERHNLALNYIDTKLILRAIIERYITQKFILTDPQRLANLFLYWGRIENKRFHTSREKLQDYDLSTLALDMDFEGEINKWSTENEQEYQDFVLKWESLVQPKQKATKAKSWSGYSLAEMAKLAEIEDIYKLTYRETSWYSHGLITVSDFFLRHTENGLGYSASTSQLQQIECYLQTEKLLAQSFICVDKALSWNLAKKINKVEEEDISSIALIWEFIRLYII